MILYVYDLMMLHVYSDFMLFGNDLNLNLEET